MNHDLGECLYHLSDYLAFFVMNLSKIEVAKTVCTCRGSGNSLMKYSRSCQPSLGIPKNADSGLIETSLQYLEVSELSELS